MTPIQMLLPDVLISFIFNLTVGDEAPAPPEVSAVASQREGLGSE